MSVSTRASGNTLVLSPREDLLAGGSARDFESSVQELLKAGYRHLVTDLRSVSAIDSAGVRALVRALTTSQRLEGSFALVAPGPRVRAVLQTAHLEPVFPIFESLEGAVARKWPWPQIRLAAVGLLLVAALLAAGSWIGSGQPSVPHAQPFAELLKLVAAAAIGMLVTAVRRRQHRTRLQSRSME